MHKIKSTVTLLVLITTFISTSAYGMRCGNSLVSLGDRTVQVKHICGAPASKQAKTIYRSGLPSSPLLNRSNRYYPNTNENPELLIHQRSLVEIQVEEWVYNFGPNRFMRIVSFQDGRVVSITSDGYGFR